ncbi:aspartate/glutamate racemase family protein [Mesobacillus harenae]|uniref:aspartate/glutamate racemase family protein n=1 Tax=Mesobacillus harenae TaxID=2213203 RepID=UPI00157FD8C3|nr:amino acid racemase [Mesobacillus harenae]
MSLTLGILGGMGPLTTIELAKRIIQQTHVKVDQEHIPMIIYNNPKIPSRIDAIMQGTESPLKELIKSVKKLEDSGANLIILVCNTAHYWYQELANKTSVPIYNMIEGTVHYTVKNYDLNKNKILLLATNATIKVGLYEKEFYKRGHQILIPTLEEQELITSIINDIKAGFTWDNPWLKDIQRLLEKYKQKDIDLFLAGCTEISLLFSFIDTKYQKIDPLEIISSTLTQNPDQNVSV